jgi:hypothetical protein
MMISEIRDECELRLITILKCDPKTSKKAYQTNSNHFLIFRELLVPLASVQFVAYTPTVPGFFNPQKTGNDQLEIEYLRRLKEQVEEERQFKKTLASSTEMLKALKR